MATKATAVEPPVGYVVLETFVVMVDGVPVCYAKGRTIEPGHPALKTWPGKFGPITFNIPVPRKARLSAPEVRAD